MDFIAIDFETATFERHSACALGVASVENGSVVAKHRWLIQPPGNVYDDYLMSIVGDPKITPGMTKDAPLFNEVWPEIEERINGERVVAHNASFDVSVMRHSLEHYGLSYPEFDYYCSRVLSRCHWGDMNSYSLPLVAQRCGVRFEHHEPSEDAYAAAAIVLHINGEYRCGGIEELSRTLGVSSGSVFPGGYAPCGSVKKKVSEYVAQSDTLDEEHPLFGAKVVFTGEMRSMTRDKAIQCLVDVGGIPSTGVSKKTDFLVVGAIDFDRFVDGTPSNKLKKAIDVKAAGGVVEIIPESDFLELL